MTAATINGIQYHYVDAGQGSTLLFVHGFPLNSSAWRRQIKWFQAAHRLVAPDLRGFGDTGASPGPVSMAQYADDLHTLLEHLGISPVVLVAHSMGGYIALAFARKFPDSLRGLVLVGTKAGADTPEAAANRRKSVESIQTNGTQEVIDTMLPKMFSPNTKDPALVDEVRSIMAAAKQEGVVGALLGMADRPDSTPVLAQIAVPALVITGQDDQVIPPAESQKLADAIRGAELKTIPHAGHVVAMEKPEAFNRALNEWLDRLHH